MSTVPSTKRGPDGSHAFVAMKLVKGPTLDSADRIPAKKAEVLALHDAHDHGVILRDVKPENIGIARNPLKAYVTDFGLANQQQGETSVSAFRVGIGTVPHMPPEQAQGRARDVDRRTDVYSPGASRYELATAWPVVDARILCSALVQIVERGSRVALGIPRPLRHHPQGDPKSSGRPMRGGNWSELSLSLSIPRTRRFDDASRKRRADGGIKSPSSARLPNGPGPKNKPLWKKRSRASGRRCGKVRRRGRAIRSGGRRPEA